ncbi:ABC transporter ATP-binding protein [Olivibacter domesticus]|uniref:ABC-2 type transport system ATP-binding protein n=1 Tax=Olivibacter domesticus TaxID=407022 RepID=A0A1H7V5G6_OLID1|nr:ATP-binding cassette domain-containing protein [Olivibacter domesticus]SEM04299.1 ABC-2 type transport system ATP-binding protein [Olivibacter domesticus]
MSLVVKGLTKDFSNQRAIDDVSFAVKENKVIGFLGPNGAGKSTSMKIIAGFLKPTKGSVSVQGLDIRQHNRDVKRLIGYLPENNPLYLDMYVRESLRFTADIYQLHQKQQRIDKVIDMVGLGDETRKKIKELSKGYKQRLGIAQAILHDPKLLILDEPTAGLDPNQLQDIRSLIKALGKEKIVVFSTHIMQEVEAVCDEIIFINKGKIVGDFTLSDLAKNYDNKRLEEVFRYLTQ